MLPLSLPNHEIKADYDVVVVGSGYGGAIAASRMARAGKNVCLLERGKEFLPGDFPATPTEALGEVQTNSAGGCTGGRTDLFDFNLNDDINVLVGCGLGGTSLINANVSLKAKDWVFQDTVWPDEIRQDVGGLIEQGYKRAKAMLLPTEYPEDAPELPKLQSLEASARVMRRGARFSRPPITVNFDIDGPNHVGVEQHPCQYCGDCVSGCNYRAKNTTQMNYLPDARNHGAEIFTEMAVRYVEQEGDHWLVHYQWVESGQEKFDAPPMTVRAEVVILSAGTLGSTEILLRSRCKGLTMSDMLGRRFSGNGDVLGFAYNTERQMNSIGYGDREVDMFNPVGPCITGVIDLRDQGNLNDGMVIEEGVIPGALSSVLPMAFANQVGTNTATKPVDILKQVIREAGSRPSDAYHGAMNNTQIYLVMTHDDANGEMYLQDDRLRISWPGVGQQEIFNTVNENLIKATKAHNGIFIRSLILSEFFFGHEMMTVHPLGGCVMGDDAECGVVNHRGQVFSSREGKKVYEGLYVTDGSVIPRAIGVNPLLTISAISERCCELIVRDECREDTLDPSDAPIQPIIQDGIGIRFTERMSGYFSKVTDDSQRTYAQDDSQRTYDRSDFQRAYDEGDFQETSAQNKAGNSNFKFILTIQSDNLEQMLADEQHPARMVGSVIALELSAEPLTVTDGHFNLFVDHPSDRRAKLMEYRMRLTAETGDTFYFYGCKVLRDDSGTDKLPDATTLYISVWQGQDNTGELLGRGVLTISVQDFMEQLKTIKAINARSKGAALPAVSKFVAFFAREMYEIYGLS